MTSGDQVDTRLSRQQRDVRMRLGGLEQCRLHRPARRIVDMHDAAVRMAALARQVQRLGFLVERHAHFDQPLDRVGRIFNDELDRLAPVEPRARDHRIVDMIFERVARVEYRRDPALRPGGRSAGQLALRENENAAMLRKRDRRRQPRRAGTDNDDVVGRGLSHSPRASDSGTHPQGRPHASTRRRCHAPSHSPPRAPRPRWCDPCCS